MENLSNMCICLHGSGARRPPYTHYLNCLKITLKITLIYPKNSLNFALTKPEITSKLG